MANSSPRGKRIFDLYLAATYLSHKVFFLYTYNVKDFEGVEGLRLWPAK